MPIDASIPLQGKNIQLADPLQSYGQAMQLRSLAGQQELQQMQIQQSRRNDEQEKTLADLYAGNINPDGTVNRQGILSGAASKGLGARIPDLQKKFADADKDTAATEKAKFDLAKQRMEASASALNSLVAKPDVTHADVISTLSGLVQQGMITPEQGQQAVQELPGNPAQLRPFLMQKGLQVMDAAKRMDLLTPEYKQMDVGGGVQTGTVDKLTGTFKPGATIAKTVSPDTIVREAGDERRSKRTDARERDLAAQGVTYQPDADGGYVALPTKAAPGTTMKGALVLGPDGKPLQRPLKDIPSAAQTAIISNTQNINKVQQAIDLIDGKTTGELKGDKNATGLKGYLPNTVLNRMDPEGTDTRAMIADIGSLVLHDRSGASVTASESPRLMPFIPLATDDKATVRKKLVRFKQLYEQEQQALQDTYSKDQGFKANPGKAASNDVPDDIAAILNKHGGGK